MSRAPKYAPRRELDAYQTPDDLAGRLVATLPLVWGVSQVLEPHVGGGAFTRHLAPKVGAVDGCDINPDAPGLAHVRRALRMDFLDVCGSWDWVIGNPPYRNFERHVNHALTLAPRVAFLLRLAAMESAGRVPCWRRWPLRRVWVLAERPSFTGGCADSAAYGWFLFEQDFRGPAEVVPGWSWK